MIDPGDDARLRLRATAERHLATAFGAGSDPTVTAEVSKLAADWLQLRPGRVVRDKAGRLRLSPPSVATLRSLASTLRWMADARYHHGQQARETAAKVLRGLRERRLPFDELLAQASRFRSERHKHIRTNAITRRHAPATTIDLAAGARAVRMGTIEELRRLGARFGNCLQQGVMARFHAQALRDGETEFWWIDGPGADRAPMWCLSVSRDTGRVEEIDHARNAGAAFPDRDALIGFLQARGARIDDESRAGVVLLPLGITAATIAGGPARMARTARLDDASWSIEGVPGALSAWASDPARGEAIGQVTVASFVLCCCRSRGATVPILRWTPPIPLSGAPDEDLELLLDRHAIEYVAERALYESSVRNALRRAFHADPGLGEMLRAMFREAPDWFMEDWFGARAVGIVAA